MSLRRKNSNKNKSNKSRKLIGGKTSISSPVIKYTNSKNPNNPPTVNLTCTKCDGTDFIVKTLTMGTKTKSFFNMEILDNRFKIFQCAGCGFVQIFSNEVTCNNSNCDPNLL
jgi:predicted nucleic-acid-binding Zn-ribbon protein